MASQRPTAAGEIAADIQGWDAIGSHRTGSGGDERTAAWLSAQVPATGATPRRESFVLQRWLPGEWKLTVGEHSVEGVPLFDGDVTNAAGIRAPLAPLVAGAPTKPSIGLGAIGTDAGTDANQAFAQARASGRWAALVALAKMNANAPGLALQNADRFTNPVGPPVLQVATEHESWLSAAAQKGLPVHLVVHVCPEAATGWNVTACVAGKGPHAAPLVVVTPKSSWWVSTAERGGGIAAWLALLRHFHRQPPPRPVLFVATSGHELGHLGLDYWLKTNRSLATSAHAWLHLGANFAARGSRARLQAADATLGALARSALADAGVPAADETPIGQTPGGEARNIHALGGRYVSLLGTNPWFHHPDDRWPTTIDLARTERFVRALTAIATQLAAA